MIKLSKKIFLILFFVLISSHDQSSQSNASTNKLVTVKVFSSLTCPHCANFHEKIFYNLKKDFINKGLVKFEHKGFPLDLAALNAEKILRCKPSSELDLQFLSEIYKKQNKWAVGSDIVVINESIKEIGINFGLTNSQMEKCLVDKSLEDKILTDRIKYQKNFKINSTPTVYINEKKYEGKINYKAFKKIIEKSL
tara:strand:- start:1057 stop:1641 length:585 start_codon:yes stop_codon:yes gene_type:complete